MVYYLYTGILVCNLVLIIYSYVKIEMLKHFFKCWTKNRGSIRTHFTN